MLGFAAFKLGTVGRWAMVCFLTGGVFVNAFAKPDEAKSSDVQTCRYLDTVEGSSGYGKKYSWQGVAKDSALNRAEKLGASHIVWEQFVPVGAFNGIAVAKVYDCNATAAHL